MAAALALLVILPVLASEGQITTTDGTDTVNVAVFAVADAATTTDDAGEAAFVTNTNSRDTKVGNVLYVSNRSSAFRRVFVTITNPGQAAASITADVKNVTTGATALTLTLEESTSGDVFQGMFDIVTTVAGGADPPQVAGTDGHEIQVQFGAIVVKLTVDDKKPKIESTTPDDKKIQTSDSADFSATITDTGSGLRPDKAGEAGFGSSADVDGDGVNDEPLSNSNGTSVDIKINIGFTDVDGSTGSSEFSGLASAGWTTVADGFSFTLTKGSLAEGDTFWNIEATDRAGNKRTTDADGSAGAKDNFTLTFDKKDPKIVKAETGIGWDSGKEEEKKSRDSIKVTFTEEGNAIVGGEVDPSNADFLDNGTVDAIDFRVEASKSDTSILAIDSVIHPNLKKKSGGPENLGGAEFETRHIVYIKLSNDLVPDAKPRINLIGNLRDKAGRASPPHSVVAVDKIEPKLTITITSEGGAASRPVAEGDSDDEINIRVVSDEDLNTAPSIYFVDFIFDNLASNRLEVDSVSTAISMSAVSGLDNTWDTDQEAGGGGKPDNSLIGVHIVATDKNGNVGVNKGVSVKPSDATAPTAAKDPPAAGNTVDLSKMRSPP
ncbi:MAG: hypothetical protein IIC32_01935, partial [Chloroflexi bacterium]|nr:hypothetical protein [Chloroflexota bacterium]